MKYYIIIMFIAFSGLVQAQEIGIGLKNGFESEEKIRTQLIDALKKHDVKKWTFTDTIVIANGEIPHSHPVLTLSARPKNDLTLLGTYVHENIHWFLLENDPATKKVIALLKLKYKAELDKGQEGARDGFSTYLHLIVNYLEYKAIEELGGTSKAEDIFNKKRYYQWIYKTVLRDREYLRKLLHSYRLII